ncbi:hypothetical protein FM125_02945 [Micrococcus lylae]|uniref:Uncharacterized protein n=1 Tax=Micrococcus lylae TaxID=1273 RepID=A0A1R4IK26_9MICC|nr:hypothetical protein FM125_02945 [Micrococcus lylae]
MLTFRRGAADVSDDSTHGRNSTVTAPSVTPPPGASACRVPRVTCGAAHPVADDGP